MAYVPFGQARGIGQANCPSMEQLMGITDPSDPCQAATSTQSPALYNAYQGALQQIQALTNPPAATSGQATTTNYTPLIVAGAAVLGVILLLKLVGGK